MSDFASPSSRPSRLPWIVALLLLAFATGLIGSPWFERTVRSRLPWDWAQERPVADPALLTRLAALEAAAKAPVKPAAPAGARGGAPAPAGNAVAAAEALAAAAGEPAPGPDDAAADRSAAQQRELDDLRSQVAQLATRALSQQNADTAGGDRLRALFAVAAVRRTLQLGQPAGRLLEPVARVAAPGDVAAIEAAFRDKATPPALRADLNRLIQASKPAPKPAAGVMGRVRDSLGDLVKVRPADGAAASADPAVSVSPADQRAVLQVARQRLESGDLPAALAAVATLKAPLAPGVQTWTDRGRALASAEAALDRVERALLATP